MDIQDACDVYKAQLELAGIKRNCVDMGTSEKKHSKDLARRPRQALC